MAKIRKKRSNPNSVEAYACTCTCVCSCNPVCPVGDVGITSSQLTNQVYTNPSNYYFNATRGAILVESPTY